MFDKEIPADIASSEVIFPSTAISAGEERAPMTAQPFASFMQAGKGTPMTTAGKTSMISPFDLARGQPPLAQSPTLDTLLAQVNGAQSTLGDLNTQLNTPNLKLKASQKYLLKNKLSDATTSMRSANAKMSADVPDEPDTSSFSGPLGRFFAYLTDGQSQMQAAQKQLQSLKDKGDNLAPGDFLLIQVKMFKAQQELEFSSVLLSNAVSDVKQLMQVQL